MASEGHSFPPIVEMSSWQREIVTAPVMRYGQGRILAVHLPRDAIKLLQRDFNVMFYIIQFLLINVRFPWNILLVQ